MNAILLFTSDRHFEVQSYSGDHGILLLHSRRTNTDTKRIEIQFTDVRAVEIRCWFDGLSILKVDADYLRNAPSRPFELIEHGNQVYALNGNGWTGFVVGGENVFFKDFDTGKSVAPPLP
jgi:hypothetical protein